MAVTLKDISARTGINVGSISQVLNRHPKAMELKPETREKIYQCAQELGYIRNEMAHSIATGKARGIAFIASDMGQVSYTGKIQEGVFEAASESGYAVYFHHLTADGWQDILRRQREWRVSGAVFHVADMAEAAPIAEALDQDGIPFGTVNLGNGQHHHIGVTTDDHHGARLAVQHLADLGHRRIAFVGSTDDTEFVTTRRTGYLDAMRQYAPQVRPRVISYRTEQAERLFAQLLDEPASERPTAVFCFMDTAALELARQAHRLGIDIPGQMSLVGFGDLDIAAYAAVPLTTVAQPFKEMGRLTAARVIDAIEHPATASQDVSLKLETRLVIRESTAACPA